MLVYNKPKCSLHTIEKGGNPSRLGSTKDMYKIANVKIIRIITPITPTKILSAEEEEIDAIIIIETICCQNDIGVP